jgi:hypothetical protein
MPPYFVVFRMDPFMENSALRGEAILFQNLFKIY